MLSIERLLKSIGKRCFVNCFEVALSNGGNLTLAEMHHLDRMLVGTKDNAMRTRQSKIAEIFQRDEQWRVLRMCCSVRGDSETEEKAADILSRHDK